MSGSKTNVIIQSRFASTRLPGKALYPVCGVPLLAFLIRRLKHALPPDDFRIIVATTAEKQDDLISTWAIHEKVRLVRGDEDDVLSRYRKALERFPSKVNIRVTGDNPLTCPHQLMQCVAFLKNYQLEYCITEDLPYGTGVDLFTGELLKALDTLAADAFDREHINSFVLKQPGRFRTGGLRAKGPIARPDLRMTVDTPEDYHRITRLAGDIKEDPPWKVRLETAVAILDTQ